MPTQAAVTIFQKIPCTIVLYIDYYSECIRNHSKFLLHFLIYIHVLMLCRKFELIPIKTFQVMPI